MAPLSKNPNDTLRMCWSQSSALRSGYYFTFHLPDDSVCVSHESLASLLSIFDRHTVAVPTLINYCITLSLWAPEGSSNRARFKEATEAHFFQKSMKFCFFFLRKKRASVASVTLVK